MCEQTPQLPDPSVCEDLGFLKALHFRKPRTQCAGRCQWEARLQQVISGVSCCRTKAERVRKPRCCRGPQGLLPRYLESQAEGQEQLFKLTDNIQDEL